MATTYYHWDPVDDVIMYETDENGDVTVEYTHEPGLHGAWRVFSITTGKATREPSRTRTGTSRTDAITLRLEK